MWVKAGPPPAPRTTIEVDTSWLEQGLPAEDPPASSPNAPKRRETMQVKLEWLEEEGTKSRRGSRSSIPAVAPKKGPPPLPREEPDEPRTASKKAPPPLPPEELAKRPSRAAMRAVKKGPPPLPREEPDDEPAKKRPSKRP